MLRMNQIDEIKELQRQELGPQEVAGRLNLNRKTVARYMKVVAFLTEPAVVDRIIRHLRLTFVAEKPPPAHAFDQVALMAALMEAMRTARLPLRPVLMGTV